MPPHDLAPQPDATPRAQARIRTIDAIKEAARARLVTEGPDLSLRAVARDLGVVSSAVYRYFGSRDELLTALILDGYTAMADAIDETEGQVARRDIAGRWAAVWQASAEWARARPAEYALLYGTPVPGYAAPPETTVEATRPLLVGMAILRDGMQRGALTAPTDRLPKPVRADLDTIHGFPGFEDVPLPLLARTMTAWAALHGSISFELFGRYTNAVVHLEDWFDLQVRAMARYIGIGT